MSRAARLAYVYDIGLCAVAMGCLLASPLDVGAKLGLAAAFLAVVNGITEVGLTLVRLHLARQARDASGASPRVDEATRSESEFWKRYATQDVAGIVVHNGIVVVTGIVIAFVLRLV